MDVQAEPKKENMPKSFFPVFILEVLYIAQSQKNVLTPSMTLANIRIRFLSSVMLPVDFNHRLARLYLFHSSAT